MTKEKLIRLLTVGGFVVLIDQLTKLAIVAKLAMRETIPIVPGFFNITHLRNPGGAFGLFATQSQSFRILVFLIISSVAVGFILYIYNSVPKSHPMLANALAMIFGGAIGNLIDRVRMGEVVDFLDCYISNLHWPAYNIADSAICIGVGIFVFHLILKRMPEEVM